MVNGVKTVMLMSNTSWSIINFRASLIVALKQAGFRVLIAAPEDAYSSRISELGAEYIPLRMNNKGRNPFQDVSLFVRVLGTLRRRRPDLLVSYTVKPNIYGSIAARLLGIPVVANIVGLGTVFSREGPLQRLVSFMYRLALGRCRYVFFHNADDHRFFTDRKIVRHESARVVPGSGVDTAHFAPLPRMDGAARFTFLFLGRLLREKGVPEFVMAARQIRKALPEVRFQVLGFAGVSNPSAISAAEVKGWSEEGVVEYLGEASDVRSFLAGADCIVLPSYYREGVPRSLLEAASMGRPVITTNVPGCRDAVIDRESGFLVEPRNVPDLIEKMTAMLKLSEKARDRMGLRGRQHVQAKFDDSVVIGRYLGAIQGET